MDSDDKPRWERPRARRTGPIRRGVGEEYLESILQDPGARSTAESSQDAAYRVLADYLRYSEALARGRPDLDGPGAAGSGTVNYRSLAMNMFDLWTRFAEVWFQMLEQGLDLRQGRMPDLDSFAGDRPGRGEREHPGETGDVTLAIRSRQPVEARVSLRPGDFSDEIVAHALRATAEGLPAIPATVERVDHGIVVRVQVPDEQPPGTYNGLLIDTATERPRGDVNLRVLEGR